MFSVFVYCHSREFMILDLGLVECQDVITEETEKATCFHVLLF
jgi:hypothetical protein